MSKKTKRRLDAGLRLKVALEALRNEAGHAGATTAGTRFRDPPISNVPDILRWSPQRSCSDLSH